MAGTTAISDLQPTQANSSLLGVPAQIENIAISNPLESQISSRETDINKISNQNQDQQNYNEMISSLQKATLSGQTNLPDRNIPTTTTNLTTDENIQQEHIPKPSVQFDIENNTTSEDILDHNKKLEKNTSIIENYYQEFHEPILIAVLYFLFQLPIFQKYLYKIIPSLFKSDGNPNVFGYLINSIVFGISFYFIIKGLNYFSH
tara:strand:- start:63 stop:674 length:612 start_codon:yes stop_codon:yes gene_type:complete